MGIEETSGNWFEKKNVRENVKFLLIKFPTTGILITLQEVV